MPFCYIPYVCTRLSCVCACTCACCMHGRVRQLVRVSADANEARKPFTELQLRNWLLMALCLHAQCRSEAREPFTELDGSQQFLLPIFVTQRELFARSHSHEGVPLIRCYYHHEPCLTEPRKLHVPVLGGSEVGWLQCFNVALDSSDFMFQASVTVEQAEQVCV